MAAEPVILVAEPEDRTAEEEFMSSFGLFNERSQIKPNSLAMSNWQGTSSSAIMISYSAFMTFCSATATFHSAIATAYSATWITGSTTTTPDSALRDRLTSIMR